MKKHFLLSRLKYKIMKIAQVSPLYESVPPKMYGGTERVVSFLTEELTSLGHEVYLFASGDSTTSANLIPFRDKAVRLDESCYDKLSPHFAMMEEVERQGRKFDIIHSHIDYIHYPLIRRSKFPHLVTLHGRLDSPELFAIYKEYNEIPVVSISDSQRKPLPFANWKNTIYHGLPENLFKVNKKTGDYLAVVGRISPEKGIDRAIEIAIKAGIPIKIAAKIDKADEEYYEAHIKELFKHPLVEYIGEINDHEKQDLLGNALALMFLIDWPEPFGLVMIEAMACGTPIVAYSNGSVPEIIEKGVNGFLVNSQDEALKAVQNINLISRLKCRQVFDERFTARRMALDYLNVYESLTHRAFTAIGNGQMKQNNLKKFEKESGYGKTN
jgi:glycosyltransferase involved in cell wall biosynthesis